ncbi:uncharacterized protein C8Q71DRAFT_68000 [Rhodofomes roseus]|uniref:Uncharacterized protein n=1 Tax=Rhodofomes roseus TaxID=34475 RepID=A0ABQ8KES0_9APHY|nr:uncharacterized protein C8Q71DRAFT_68000 [Rhodofomes roseus]KAH9836133.1 hypothetical protein C8Q71DRAFT_68000 [Rhodofomes roseus]
MRLRHVHRTRLLFVASMGSQLTHMTPDPARSHQTSGLLSTKGLKAIGQIVEREKSVYVVRLTSNNKVVDILRAPASERHTSSSSVCPSNRAAISDLAS